MLSQDVFNEGMKNLKAEYGNSFNDDPKRLRNWWARCKDMTDVEFEKRVELVMETCRKVPYLADLLDEEISVKAKNAANNAFTKEKGGYDWVYVDCGTPDPVRVPRYMAVEKNKEMGIKFFETEKDFLNYKNR